MSDIKNIKIKFGTAKTKIPKEIAESHKWVYYNSGEITIIPETTPKLFDRMHLKVLTGDAFVNKVIIATEFDQMETTAAGENAAAAALDNVE